MTRFYLLWAEFLYKYGKHIVVSIILLSILLTILVVNKVQNEGLPLDFTPQSIFLDEGEMVQHLRDVEKTFGREDNDFLVLLKGEGLSDPNNRVWFERVHQELESISDITAVHSLMNAEVITSTDGMMVRESIWNAESPWEKAQSQPVMQNLLTNKDGTVQVIQVRVDSSLEKVSELRPVHNSIQKTLQQNPPPNQVSIQLTGVPYIRVEIVDLMMKDELFYVPTTGIIFLLTIFWLFRGFRLALAPVVAVQISMFWAVGLLILSGVTFNILSMLIPAIAMIIGAADGIHLVSRFREERNKQSNHVQALANTLQSMSRACFWTTFTTASGFASLLVADTIVIKDFGLHSAIAVSIMFIGIMIITPVWLRFLPDSVFDGPHKVRRQWEGALTWVHGFAQKRYKAIILISGVLCLCATWIASTLQANSYILEMYEDDHPTVLALDTVEKELSGIVPVFVHFESDSTFDTLDRLQLIGSIQDFIGQYPFVGWSTSIAEQHKMVHSALTDEWALPDTQALLAQENLLISMSGGLPTSTILSKDKTETRILLLCEDIGGVEFLKFRSDLNAHIQSLLPSDEISWTITGDGMLASIGIDKLISDLLKSVGLVFLIIFLVLALLIRDLAQSILAFIPNVLPLLMTLTLLVLVGQDLQVSNIVSFTVAIGLTADDTIHFIARYREEVLKGNNHSKSMLQAILGAGHAIILTSILLICGFGLLATSSLTSTYYFGVLTAITLVSAILADLLLLPALFNWWNAISTNQRHD